MALDEAGRRRLIKRMAEAVIAAEAELTALDQAIGDGDHGLNMKRGFSEVLARLDDIAAKPLPGGLKDLGMTLVMKVGGASGPLYGTLFIGLAKTLPEEPETMADVASAADEAVKAVMARGKSEPGQKTMLDVLAPVSALLAEGAELDDIAARAAEAAEATIPMQATRGRASFLGERSVGHMDPGARSSQLIIAAACKVLGEGA